MAQTPFPPIESAVVVLPTTRLAADLEFFESGLGFRIDSIHPADDPRVAVLSGHGLRLRLQQADAPSAVVLQFVCDDPPAARRAPGGTRVEFVPPTAGAAPPRPVRQFVVTHATADARWVTGRAGMLYRDLVPDRQGGYLIASHIRIADGGPVPDYVHYHDVRFQIIYCQSGWARLVYEDQGPPFVLAAGDCVLQPPGIRHRVLESSPGLEVIELTCPAEHETHVDHELTLPTPSRDPKRVFGGSRFVHHRAATASWLPLDAAGFEGAATDIESATGGIGAVRTLRCTAPAARLTLPEFESIRFLFVLAGAGSLTHDNTALDLEPGTTVVPTATAFLTGSPGLQILEVMLR